MKRLLLGLLAAALLCGLFPGCAGETRRQATFTDVFDTVTVLTASSREQAEFDAMAALLHETLLDYHRLFDIYKEYPDIPNLRTVNLFAGEGPVAVDGAVLAMLEEALALYATTNGKLNVALGSVLSLWHQAREAGLASPAQAALPDDTALEAAAQHTDPASVRLDREAGTVFFADPALRLDVGGFAKGWAAGQACKTLLAAGYSDFILTVGGNVCAVGRKGGSRPWVVGVENPDGSGAYLAKLLLEDCCAVTSGTYQRYYTVDGRRYHHIIDPETLYPAERYTLVTVVAEDSGLADALSTALFCLDEAAGQALLDATGAEALWCYPDGSLRYSTGFSRYLQH